MRRTWGLPLAVAGMFIFASAAVSQANWYYGSEGTDGGTSEMMAPPEEAGTYQQQEPSEAGKIPSGEKAMTPGEEPRAGDDFPTVDSGGLKFRESVDTGP